MRRSGKGELINMTLPPDNPPNFCDPFSSVGFTVSLIFCRYRGKIWFKMALQSSGHSFIPLIRHWKRNHKKKSTPNPCLRAGAIGRTSNAGGMLRKVHRFGEFQRQNHFTPFQWLSHSWWRMKWSGIGLTILANQTKILIPSSIYLPSGERLLLVQNWSKLCTLAATHPKVSFWVTVQWEWLWKELC